LRNSHDDEQERRVRLLLLSKGAVLAHWFDRPLAAGMDEKQKRRSAHRRIVSATLDRREERASRCRRPCLGRLARRVRGKSSECCETLRGKFGGNPISKLPFYREKW